MIGKGKVDKAVTLVAANTEIAGDLRFSDQLFVNGRIHGNLVADPASDATVVISAEGSVCGDIRVPNIVISGQVEGNVFGSSRVELAAKARVRGNVYYKLMEMQLGAQVEGQLLHEEQFGDAAGAVELRTHLEGAEDTGTRHLRSLGGQG